MSKVIDNIRAAYQEVQEKKLIDLQADINGGIKLDTETQVHESKFLIPEEIPANERTAFMGAAAAAHKAGKSHFNFGGKKHAVTMKKDTAQAVNSDTQKEAVVDTHKSADKKPENYTDADGKQRTRMVPTKKKQKASEGGKEGDIDMNPKMEKEAKVESRIRSALLGVLAEDKHTKGATKPETMDDKIKGKGAKDMMDPAKKAEVNDTETKGHKDASDAGRVTKAAGPRKGDDNVRSGDQKIIPSATPAKGMKKTMEAYASMTQEKKELSELSPDLLNRYKDKANKDYHDKVKVRNTATGKKKADALKKSVNRHRGIGSALKRDMARGGDGGPNQKDISKGDSYNTLSKKTPADMKKAGYK